MRGSQLDRRITIEAPATVDGDYGPQPGGWTSFAARIPAQVQDTLPGKFESVQQGLRIAAWPARVRIRYLAGVTSAMRIIVHGATDRTMHITAGPAEIGRREWLEFVVTEFSS